MWLRKLRDEPPTDEEMTRWGCEYDQVGMWICEFDAVPGSSLRRMDSRLGLMQVLIKSLKDSVGITNHIILFLHLCSGRNEAKAAVLKGRVAAIEEQERLRRLRMESMGMHVSVGIKCGNACE